MWQRAWTWPFGSNKVSPRKRIQGSMKLYLESSTFQGRGD
jgi:hypothetical protein